MQQVDWHELWPVAAVEGLCKLAKEGEALHIKLEEDSAGCLLVVCMRDTEAWLEQCHTVLVELKVRLPVPCHSSCSLCCKTLADPCLGHAFSHSLAGGHVTTSRLRQLLSTSVCHIPECSIALGQMLLRISPNWPINAHTWQQACCMLIVQVSVR